MSLSAKRIVINVFSNWGVLLAQFIASMIMAPIYVHFLKLDLLGILQIISGVTTQFVLLDMGFGTTLTKYVAEAKGKREFSTIWTVLFTGLLIYGTISAIALLIGGGLYFFIDRIFEFPASHLSDTRHYFILAILTLAIGYIRFPFVGLLNGFQKYFEQNIVKVVKIVISNVIIWFLLVNGFGIVALGATGLILEILTVPLFVWLSYRELRGIPIKSYFSKDVLKKLWKYSVYVFLAVIAQRLFDYFDTILLGVFASAAVVPVFYYGFQILMHVRRFTASISRVLLPVVSEMHADNNQAAIYSLFTFGSKVVITISLMFVIPIIIVGSEFFGFWLGDEFNTSHTVFLILSIPNLFIFSQRIGIPILYGTGKHNKWALFQLGNAVLKLGLSIYLLKTMESPVLAVAWGTAIPLVIYFIFLQLLFHKSLNFNMINYYRMVYLPFIVPLLIQIGLLITLKYLIGIDGWIDLILVVAITTPIFLLAVLRQTFSKADKEKILSRMPIVNNYSWIRAIIK